MKDIESLVRKGERVLPDEDMLIEALRDLIKDQIKEYLKEIMDRNPRIREEIAESVRLYVEAKIKEANALATAAKALAELGITSLPREAREQILATLLSMLREEMEGMVDKL